MSFFKKLLVTIIKKIYLAVPLKKKSAAFISHPDFSDNIYPIYIELRHLGYKCLWILYDKELISFCRPRKIKHIMFKKTARNVLTMSRYKYIFYSHGRPELYEKKGQVTYICWHGSPFKKYRGGLIDNTMNNTFFIPSSVGCLNKYKEHYPQKVDLNKSLSYRHFRTDYFVKDYGLDEKQIVTDFFNLNDYSKVALCCLTWIRNKKVDDEVNNILGFELDIKEFEILNTELRKNNELLIVKPHPEQKIIGVFNYSNIKVISSTELAKKGLQLYALISQCDILFTDYSSILFDYCLLDKPVGHIIHDWEYFKNDDNEQFIYDNPDDIMYGTKIYNFSELINFLINPKDNDEIKRKKINEEYNDDPYLTCSSTQKFIKEVLENEKI